MPLRKGGYRSLLPRDQPIRNIRGLRQKFKCLSAWSSSSLINGRAEAGHQHGDDEIYGFNAEVTTPILQPKTRDPPQENDEQCTNFLETTMDMTGIETSMEEEEDEQSFFAERRQANLIGSVLVIDDVEGAVERELGDPLVYTYSADSSGTDQEVEVIMQGTYWDRELLPHSSLHEHVFQDTATSSLQEEIHSEDLLKPEETISQPFPNCRFGLEQVYYSEANTWRAKADIKKLNHRRHQSDASTSATQTTASNSSVSIIRSTGGSCSNNTMQSLSSQDMAISEYDSAYLRLDGFYFWDTS